MTRDQIVAVFGADTTKIDEALRGMRGKFKGAAEASAATFAAPFKSIATGLTGMFTYDGIQNLGQKFKEIKSAAENAGTSVQFMDGLKKSVAAGGDSAEKAQEALGKFNVKVGDARSGVKSAAEDFNKWGISLYDSNGNAVTTEVLLGRVADRMQSIKDPALQSKMAFDLFSKAGFTLISSLSGGSAALEEWKKKSKLDNDMIKQVIDLQMNLKLAGDTSTMWAAKTVAAIATVARGFGTMSDVRGGGLVGFLEFIKGQGILRAAANAAPPMMLKSIYDYQRQVDRQPGGVANHDAHAVAFEGRAQAERELEEALKRFKQAGESDEEQLKRLNDEWKVAQNELSKYVDGTEAAIRQKTKLVEIAEKIKLTEQQIAEAQKRQAEQEEARMAQQRQREQKSLDEFSKAKKALGEAQAERYGFSIEQLAGGGQFDPASGVRGVRARRNARRSFNSWMNNLSPEERYDLEASQEIQSMRERADFLRSFGHFDEAQRLLEGADDLAKTLNFAKPSEADPLRQQVEQLKTANETLEGLLEAALGSGINVNPANGQ